MKRNRRILPFALAAILTITNMLVLVVPASAAQLSNSSIRLDRMSTGTYTTFRVRIKPATAGATSVAINFNGADTTTWTGSGGTLGAQASQTDSTAACVNENGNGDVALPGTHTFTVSGSTLTIGGVTALAAGTSYCDDLTFITGQTAGALKTPTSAGEYHPTITAGSDSSTVAVRVVANDQVVVNAVVAPTFNFVLSGNTDTFAANLAPGSVSTSNGVTATVNTNAKTGWVAWAKDSNTGLTSATVTKTIASTTPGTAATLSAGTEGYVFGITSITQGSGTGTTSAATAYNGATANTGSGLDGTLRQIATSTGTASNAVLNLNERAAISSLTPAASDYTDTITIIGAGNF